MRAVLGRCGGIAARMEGDQAPSGHVLSLPLRLAHIGAVEQMFGAEQQVRRRACGA